MMSKAADGRVSLVMEMDSLAAGIRMGMIIAGDEMFANLPGAGWMRLDASALSGMLGQARSGIDDPLGMFDSLFSNRRRAVKPVKHPISCQVRSLWRAN